MRKTIGVVLGGMLGLFLAGSALAADCKLQKFVELPVTMSGTRPMVSAKIDGHEVTFMADSGAFFSTLSPSVASELGLHLGPAPWGMRFGGVGGEVDAHMTTVKTFTFVGIPLPNVEFFVMPGAGGRDSAGLLGQNIWGLGDVEYDLGGGAIRLFKVHDCGDRILAYWAEGKPVNVVHIGNDEERDKKTFADAFVNGKRIRVIFDSGASTSVMKLSAAERVGLHPNDPGVRAAGLSGGIGEKASRNWIGPVSSFKIGDEEVKNTRMRFGELELGNADMLLGADFFLSHRIYVANSQHRLFFTYNGGPVFNLTAPPSNTARGLELSGGPATGGADSSPGAEGAAASADEPRDAGGYSRRGAAEAGRHDYERALADYTKAIELDPTDPRYTYQRALTHLALRQPLLAVDDFNQTLKLQPDNVEAMVARAELRLASRDRAGALADMDKAADLAPKSADVRLQLAGFYERVDLFDKAIAQFDLWISSHDEDSGMSRALTGRCRTRALAGKELDKALSDCNRAIRMGPQSTGMHDSRGMIHLRQGEYDRAIADYNSALTVNPRLAWSLYGRGIARLHKGLKAEGDADIAAALGITPRLAETAKRYGIVSPSTASADLPPPQPQPQTQP